MNNEQQAKSFFSGHIRILKSIVYKNALSVKSVLLLITQ